jgi:hypothetical protein
VTGGVASDPTRCKHSTPPPHQRQRLVSTSMVAQRAQTREAIGWVACVRIWLRRSAEGAPLAAVVLFTCGARGARTYELVTVFWLVSGEPTKWECPKRFLEPRRRPPPPLPPALDPAAPDAPAAPERTSVKHISWTVVAVLAAVLGGPFFCTIYKNIDFASPSQLPARLCKHGDATARVISGALRSHLDVGCSSDFRGTSCSP